MEARVFYKIFVVRTFSCFRNCSQQQQQLASSSYQHTQLLLKFFTSTWLRLELSTQQLSRFNYVSLLQKAMYSNRKAKESTFDPTKPSSYAILHPEIHLIPICKKKISRKQFQSMTWCISVMRRTS